MGFTKIGAIFPIAQVQVTNPEVWSAFKKKASIGTAVLDEKLITAEEIKSAVEKTSDFAVVADIDTDKYIYIHTTIMAGVKTADNGFWVTAETDKYINDNHDAWRCEDLLKDYPSFRTAKTFVEHDQNIERAKGKCIDAIARKLPDTVLIDVLFSVDKRHGDLVNNITSGIVNSVSMGCTTEKTRCSICGTESTDSNTYCSHIKNGKGQQFMCKDGTKRRSAEICVNNSFFDVSLVANPAFAGAIFRKILSSSQVNAHLLSNILNAKIETFNDNEVFLKAASKESEVTVKADGSVTVKEADKETKGNLTSEDLKKIREIISTQVQEEKSATKFLSNIINKFFGKKADHPIKNEESEKKDFAISDQNYDSLEKDFHNPHNVKPELLEQLKKQKLEVPEKETKIDEQPKDKYKEFKKASRVETFTCPKCSFEQELWRVKAASIDLGHSETLSCPKCSFIIETDILPTIKIAQAASADTMQLKDLGFKDEDIKNLTKDQIGLIILKEVTKKEFTRDPNAFLRKGFVTNQEIPVKKMGSSRYMFDTKGEAIIVKGEKLSLVSSSETVGRFKTGLDEIVFLPIVKKKQ